MKFSWIPFPGHGGESSQHKTKAAAAATAGLTRRPLHFDVTELGAAAAAAEAGKPLPVLGCCVTSSGGHLQAAWSDDGDDERVPAEKQVGELA